MPTSPSDHESSPSKQLDSEHGLFISMSNYPDGVRGIKAALDRICRDHHDKGQSGYISDLVLQYISAPSPQNLASLNSQNSSDTLMTKQLDVLLPHFPGGSGSCRFEHVYVGAIPPPRSDPQVSNSEYNDNYTTRSVEISRQFVDYVLNSSSPSAQFGWYVARENALDRFEDPNTTKLWTQFMTTYVRDLGALDRNKPFLWSPSTSRRLSDLTEGSKETIEQNLASFFGEVNRELASSHGDSLRVDLQDHIGVSACRGPLYTPEDAVAWFKLVARAAPRIDLRMNIELFDKTKSADGCGEDRPVRGSELARREDVYLRHEIPLGAAFEMRYSLELDSP